HGMQQQEQERYSVEKDHQRVAHACLEARIGLRTRAQRGDLKQDQHREISDEEAAQLAKNKKQIRPAIEVPERRHSRAISLGLVMAILRHRGYLFPQGRSQDLNHSLVAVSLY